MATLQKIRSKSVLLVSIIFVALFLFIITIIDNPLGLFMDQTSVAKVNGQKIELDEYQERTQLVSQQNPQATDAEEQALHSLVTEALYQQEFDKLGMAVTDHELNAYLTSEDAPYGIVAQFYQQFGATPADVLTAIKDPAQYGLNEEQVNELARGYSNFEQNLADQLLTQKLLSMIQGTINANKLDAKQIYDEGNTTYTLATVTKSVYETVDTVTPAEIKAYYDQHKEFYKVPDKVRYVRYVTLPITPSPADRQKAVATVNDAVAQLQEGEGMNALMGNGAYVIEHQTADSSAVAAVTIAGLRDFLKNAEVGTVQVLSPNTAYIPNNPELVIGRLVSRENRVNRATLKQVAFDGTGNTDSILAQLNAGVDPATIAGIQAAPAREVTLDQLSGVIDTLRAVGVNQYVNLGNGAAIAIEKYAPAEPMVEYYTASYAVEPSRQTMEGLNTRMRDFLIAAPTADAFTMENAMTQGLMVNETLIDQSSGSIDGLEDSRPMVAWAMDAKKGQVSRLYTDSKNTRLAAVAVVDEYKDYIPYTFPQISTEITRSAQTEKNAKKLIDATAGKGSSLADYQKLLDAQRIDTLRNVNLSAGRFGQLGAVRAAKPGEVVGPVRWNASVVVFSILDQTEGTMPFDEQSSSMQFARQAQSYILGQDPNALLLGNGKVKYNFLRFTRQ